MFFRYGFNFIGLILSVYVFYSCSARFLKIRDLPINIISKNDKNKYLGILQKYVLFTGGASLINLLAFLSPVLEIRLLVSLVSIFICTFVFGVLSDEIADFDISKKDSDIIQEFLANRKKASKENAKENKIKKVDIDELNKEYDEAEVEVEKELLRNNIGEDLEDSEE